MSVAESLWKKVDRKNNQCLVVYGTSLPFYQLAKQWLWGDKERRLFFVDEGEGNFSIDDPKVKVFRLESPLHLREVAREMAAEGVLRKMGPVLLEKGRWGEPFFQELEGATLAANMALSDVADGGMRALTNALGHREAPFRRGASLKGVFAGLPAVVIGAGASLREVEGVLATWKGRALLLGGGSALPLLKRVEPDLGGMIDPFPPSTPFRKEEKHFPFPICFQARVHGENLRRCEGERILFGEESLPLLNWLYGVEPFEGGWSVSNFLTSVALHFGCNPIVFAGVDLCYTEGKYGKGGVQEGAVLAKNRLGHEVWTQGDWLLSAHWMGEKAKEHSKTRFLTLSERGLALDPAIELVKGEALSFPEVSLPFERIREVPLERADEGRWKEWAESVERSCRLVMDPALEKELAYEHLLKPLWPRWRPVFQREAEVDGKPFSLEQKMEVQKGLFFQQILEEHGAIYRRR